MKLKFTTPAEACLNLLGYWQKWSPSLVRRRPWTPWGPHIRQFRGSIDILHALARYPVIFSLVGHITMAAEAPDHHIGDLGRLEEVRNVLTDAHTLGYKEKTF